MIDELYVITRTNMGVVTDMWPVWCDEDPDGSDRGNANQDNLLEVLVKQCSVRLFPIGRDSGTYLNSWGPFIPPVIETAYLPKVVEEINEP